MLLLPGRNWHLCGHYDDLVFVPGRILEQPKQLGVLTGDTGAPVAHRDGDYIAQGRQRGSFQDLSYAFLFHCLHRRHYPWTVCCPFS